MSITKSEIKIGAYTDLGVQFEDAKEAVERDLFRCEGATIRLAQAAAMVQQLSAHVDKDLDEGKIEDLKVAELVKLYITRAAQVVQNLSQKADNERMVTQGRMEALDGVIKITKKACDSTEAKQKAREEAENSDSSRRAVGTHPGASVKQQRAKATKAPTRKKKPTKKVS